METYAETCVGKIRHNNEDNILKLDEQIGCLDNLYIVCDGMGGHNAGEIASQLAIQYFIDYLKTNKVDLDTKGIIMDGIFSANQKVYKKSFEDDKRGMGTTMTICTFKDEKAYIGHVGDSRIYLLRDEKLIQLTNDHTYVNEMVQKGLMTKEQALVDKNRNIITRAIGIDSTVMVDTLEVDIKVGDIVMLCSDGLSGLSSDVEIKDILIKESNIEQKSKDLINSAMQNGGADNISVILICM